jgi:hypothetical protein
MRPSPPQERYKRLFLGYFYPKSLHIPLGVRIHENANYSHYSVSMTLGSYRSLTSAAKVFYLASCPDLIGASTRKAPRVATKVRGAPIKVCSRYRAFVDHPVEPGDDGVVLGSAPLGSQPWRSTVM